MIDCETVREELSAYIDNELSLSERQKIEHHLQLCKDCYDEYFELQITAAIMHSLKEIEPPPGLKEKVRERLFKEEKQGIWQKILRHPWHSLGAAAAGLLLLIGSWGLLFDGGLAKIHADLMGTTEISEKDTGVAEEGVEIQYFAEVFTEEDSSTNAEALEESPSQNEEVEDQNIDLDASQSHIERMVVPDINPDTTDTDSQRIEEEAQGHEVAITSLPAEPKEGKSSQKESIDKESTPRALALKEMPSNEAGLIIEVNIKTEDFIQSQNAIESLAHRYGLEITSNKEESLTTLEILAPISMQKSVMEQLREIGFVTNEIVSDPDLGEKINALIKSQEELLQQQSELKALIASGGSPEETYVWQEELTKVKAQIEEIQEELFQLDQELSPSTIKITLVE